MKKTMFNKTVLASVLITSIAPVTAFADETIVVKQYDELKAEVEDFEKGEDLSKVDGLKDAINLLENEDEKSELTNRVLQVEENLNNAVLLDETYLIVDDEGVLTGLTEKELPKEIIIPSNINENLQITSIGEEVFMEKDLNYVRLPEGLKEIGKSAFLENNFTTIKFPDSLEAVKQSAFLGNKVPYSLYLNEGLSVIGETAFLQTVILNDLKINKNLKSLGRQSFLMSTMPSLTIESDLEEDNPFKIESSAFQFAKIGELIFEDRETNIEDAAFMYAEIPNIHFKDGQPMNIGQGSFQGSKTNELVFGDREVTVEDGAFLQLESTKVHFEDGKAVNLGKSSFSHSKIDELVFGDREVTVEDGAFLQLESTKVHFEDGKAVNLGESSFHESKIDELVFGDREITVENRVFRGLESTKVHFEDGKAVNLGESSFHSSKIDELIFGDREVTVEDHVFHDLESTKVHFEDGKAVNLGKNSFYNSKIDELIFGDRETNIKEYAFQGIESTKVHLEDGKAVNLGEYSFFQSKIDELIFGDRETNIEEYAFQGIKSTKVHFEDGKAVNLGEHSFFFSEIDELVFGDRETNIAFNAFNMATFEKLEFKEGSKDIFIDEHGFEESTIKNKKLILPSRVAKVGDSAFLNVEIDSITFNEPSIEKHKGRIAVGSEAFQGSGVASLSLGNTLKSIGSNSFLGNNLSTINLPEDLEEVWGGAFKTNSPEQLISLNLNKKLKLIGSEAFFNDENTESEAKLKVVIPNSIEYLAATSFTGPTIHTIALPNKNIKDAPFDLETESLDDMKFLDLEKLDKALNTEKRIEKVHLYGFESKQHNQQLNYETFNTLNADSSIEMDEKGIHLLNTFGEFEKQFSKVEKVELINKSNNKIERFTKDSSNNHNYTKVKNLLNHSFDIKVTYLVNDTKYEKIFENVVYEVDEDEDLLAKYRDAEVYVKLAEVLKREPHISKAQEKINLMPDVPKKDLLENRLAAVRDYVVYNPVHVALKNAEMFPRNHSYLEKAELAIQNLNDVYPIKVEFKQRLEDLKAKLIAEDEAKELDKNMKNAEQQVKMAEVRLNEEFHQKAIESVQLLPEENEKRLELEERLKDVQFLIFQLSVDKIEKTLKEAENKKDRESFNTVKKMIDEMPASPEKNAFLERLSQLEVLTNPLIKEALVKLERAEKYPRNPYFTQAREAIEQLENTQLQIQYQDRLNVARLSVFKDIHLKNLEQNTKQRIEFASYLKQEKYVLLANELVQELEEKNKDLGLSMRNLLDQLELEEATNEEAIDFIQEKLDYTIKSKSSATYKEFNRVLKLIVEAKISDENQDKKIAKIAVDELLDTYGKNYYNLIDLYVVEVKSWSL